jgi:hypothetical protein
MPMRNTRHEVYSAINKSMTWWGIDTRIFLVAAVCGMSVLAFTKSQNGMIAAFSLFLLIATASVIASKHEARFLALFPIVTRLKLRYEPGQRGSE